MKKALFAAGLLAAMAAFSLWGVHHLRALTDELCTAAESSLLLYQQGDADGAADKAEALALRWDQEKLYTGIMLRQTEDDAVSAAIFELRECYGEGGEAALACERLCARLRLMTEMEEVRLASIF